MGQNTGLIYKEFAKGDTSWYATFEQATRIHRLPERIVEDPGIRAS